MWGYRLGSVRHFAQGIFSCVFSLRRIFGEFLSVDNHRYTIFDCKKLSFKCGVIKRRQHVHHTSRQRPLVCSRLNNYSQSFNNEGYQVAKHIIVLNIQPEIIMFKFSMSTQTRDYLISIGTPPASFKLYRNGVLQHPAAAWHLVVRKVTRSSFGAGFTHFASHRNILGIFLDF